MVNIPTGLAINTPTAADRTIPATFRKIISNLFKTSALGVPVTGILPSPGTPLDVQGQAGAMAYTVKAGYAIIARTSQGGYIVGTDADLSVPTSPADANNPRYDIVYMVQPDPELSDTGHARIDVQVGVAQSSPVPPTASLPAGAIELGRKLVAAGASNTSDGAAITNKPAQTSLAVAWSAISGVPSTFPPSAHSASLVTSGTLPAAVDVAGNLSSGLVQGKKITVSQTQPTSPATGDVWISW